ncbi:MAG TPA: aminofutalosine synthase MqnE [Bacteroidota bacterium]|nr:aminofutalosine synthase MqnE [Bacteroidota bacterium]
MPHTIHFRDNDLNPIWDKVRTGERLTLADGLTLYNTPDLIGVGKMAHWLKQQKSGDAVYFVLNRKIEPTNICVLSCKFCDFATKPGLPDAYEMSIPEILSKLSPDLAEVHITGGMPAHLGWDYYLGMVREIKSHFPNIDVKAFTAVEIDFFHKKFKMPIAEVLRQLKEAGLRSLPGGGAEVFSERVRKLLFNQKIGAKTWFEVHRTAHTLGIPTNATLLYGHIETLEERLIHMMKLREQQDETGGFLSFIPLAFQPGDTGIKARSQFTSAIDDLKTIAISRLMLDNFPHIKAYWVMLTEEVASIALNFGADDMDGTIGEEHIAHDAGAISPMKMAKDQIIKIIRDGGKIPVERDIYYNPLNIYSENVIGKIPYLNSVPFYQNFEKGEYKVLPVTPRWMGLLEEKGQVIAGPFSYMDYLRSEADLEMLNFGITTRDQVKSVMLFSNHGWSDLNGKRIGIMDDTATSVRLLQVLLEKKYGVAAKFERMNSGVNDCTRFDAVLLIGDEALKRNKTGLAGFELIFDLAKEWYDWKKLPFVFAVWAVSRKLSNEAKKEISSLIDHSLETFSNETNVLGDLFARRLSLKRQDIDDYLAGFTYRLGEREKAGMAEFRKLIEGLLSPIPVAGVTGMQRPSEHSKTH